MKCARCQSKSALIALLQANADDDTKLIAMSEEVVGVLTQCIASVRAEAEKWAAMGWRDRSDQDVARADGASEAAEAILAVLDRHSS